MEKALKFISKQIASINFSETLIGITVILNILLVVCAIIATSYFGLIVIGTGFDGWCDLKLYGAGEHCFSDYWSTKHFLEKANPWFGEPWNYPAAAMLTTFFSSILGKLTENPQLGMWIYLTLMAISISVPAFWAGRGKPVYMRLIVIGLFGITSIPALMALDRGNSIGFAVPGLLMFLIGISKNNNLITAAGILIATTTKPQYVLLAFALVVLWRWKAFLITFVAVGLTQVCSFLFWPSAFPGSILLSISNTTNYGVNPDLAFDYPISNSSISSSLFELFTFWEDDASTSLFGKMFQNNQSIVPIAITLVFLIWSFALRKSLPPELIAIYLSAFASTWVSLSWAYYFVFAIPIAAIILRDPKRDLKLPGWQGVGNRSEINTTAKRLSILLLTLVTSLTLSKIIVPFITRPPGPYPLNSSQITTSFWVISALVTLITWSIVRKDSKQIVNI